MKTYKVFKRLLHSMGWVIYFFHGQTNTVLHLSVGMLCSMYLTIQFTDIPKQLCYKAFQHIEDTFKDEFKSNKDSKLREAML